MIEKLPLPAQIRAIETTRNVILRGERLKQGERELMDQRLCAVIRTLAYLRRNEDAFRAFMATRKEAAAGEAG